MMAASDASAKGFQEIAAAARAAEAVVAMGMLPTLARRWARAEHSAAWAATRALVRNRAITAITHTLRSAMTGAMVATGLVLVLNGYASPGSLVAGNMILSRMLLPFEHFAHTLRGLAEAAAAWRRIRSTMSSAEQAQPRRRYDAALPRPVGCLSVERLVYMPPGAERPVLRGISFRMEPGEIVGVIGPSSAGKSTLLRLVLGMVEPTSGGAFLDGHSTYLWQRQDFGRHIGYVPQSVALTDGTVAENIARAEAAPDTGAVIAAAKKAGVHSAIAALPHGYATRISGSRISHLGWPASADRIGACSLQKPKAPRIG